jgi:hypothetical protein
MIITEIIGFGAFSSPRKESCARKKGDQKVACRRNKYYHPTRKQAATIWEGKKVEECVLRVSKYRGTMCFVFSRSFIRSFVRPGRHFPILDGAMRSRQIKQTFYLFFVI